jgi:hypothetical protein
LDYDLILQNAKCIIDTRGRYNNSEKVVKAWCYIPLNVLL